MRGPLKFDYYYGIEADQFSFFRVPKILMKDERFRALSSDAVLLYSMMLDRMQLSRKNGWLDEEDRVYIHYTVEDAMEDLARSRPTIVKVMKELDSVNGVGLIEKFKPGFGKPAVIYVKNFATVEAARENVETEEKMTANAENITEVKNFNFKKLKNLTSRSQRTLLQEVKDFNPNNTNINNTDLNDTDMNDTEESVSQSKGQTDRNVIVKYLKDRIDYEAIIHTECFKESVDIVDGMVNIIADIVTTDPPDGYETINGRPYPHEVVKSRLLKTDYDTITHVLARFKQNTTKIKNVRAYLLTALYNAKDEMELWTQNRLNHDLYGSPDADD